MSAPDAPIRVLIVDDQTLLREGFQRLLELEGRGIVVVATAANGLEALATIERLAAEGKQPDVVLMDIRMPQLDGIEATRSISAQWPALQVIMLTTFDEEDYIVEGLRAGAKGYLLKDTTAEHLVESIHAAARGESPLQPVVAAKLIQRFTHPVVPIETTSPAPVGAEVRLDDLTEREREILRYIARGASNREIGEALFITEGTVKNHVSSILSKLGLRDRTQAAIYAREHHFA